MYIAGVVAEFNPFHNGHAYLLEQIRQNGFTHISVAMSGSCCQRGDVAIFDKHFRAKKAIENGADLVLELPCPYSISSSQLFAQGAVKILSGLGKNALHCLCFGSETDDKNLLLECADIANNLDDSELVKDLISQGFSYPSAVHKTVLERYGRDCADIFASPNSTLAVEYIRALKIYAPHVDIMPIKRKGVGHHDVNIAETIASATKIRSEIVGGNSVSQLLPYDEIQPSAQMKNMEKAVIFKLCSMTKSQLCDIADCSEFLADKIAKLTYNMPVTMDELEYRLKSKDVTLARIRRIILACVLGSPKLSADDLQGARILAFNKRGTEILSAEDDKALNYDTSLARLEKHSESVRKIVQLENKATLFRHLCTNSTASMENEYRRKIIITP